MKALSVRQPWAWLICNAGKTIENRSWSTNYRGPILIHAAQGMRTAEFDDACAWLRWKRLPVPTLADMASAARGAIVAEASIVGVVKASTSPWFVGPYGWVLANVRPVPAVHVRGALGLFDVGWEDAEGRPV